MSEYKDIIKDALIDFIYDAKFLDDASSELDYVYAQASKADELQKQIGILSGKLDTLKINLNYFEKQAAKAEEYEVKAKSFDHARGKLFTKIKNLRDSADRADDIEVENEIRERLSKFEEVDNILMAAFVKASFGQKTKEERSYENKGRESLRAKLREKTANALDKKIEHEIKKGSERLWD